MVVVAMRLSRTNAPLRVRGIVALGLAAALLAACGNDDDGPSSSSAGDEPSQTGGQASDQAMPELIDCTFVPNDPTSTDVLVGYATVRAQNTSDQVIDTTLINFNVPGLPEQSRVAISFWQPGETIEMEAGLFSEDGPAGLEAGDCTNVDISPGSYGELDDFDAAAATCEVRVDPDATVMGTSANIDVSGVSDRPDGEQLFVTLAIRDGDTRVAEQFPYIEPGETTAQVDLFTYTDRDNLNCEVMNLRLP